ncbi:MAG: hypothetical protein OEZ06_18060 [Myxococcales bacterium]|nr:hypothetical protein [Myxococcales bacterium]
MWHLISGIVLITLGLWGMSAWWPVFGMVMRGILPFMMVVIGLVAVLSSYYRLASGYDEFFEDEDE